MTGRLVAEAAVLAEEYHCLPGSVTSYAADYSCTCWQVADEAGGHHLSCTISWTIQ